MTIASTYAKRDVDRMVADDPACVPGLYAEALTSEQYGRQRFGVLTPADWDLVKAYIRSLWLEHEALRVRHLDDRITA